MVRHPVSAPLEGHPLAAVSRRPQRQNALARALCLSEHTRPDRRRLIPVILVAALISALVSTDALGDFCSAEADDDNLFDHPYAFQLFGIVFGYLSVARLNISYARYWEGVTQIKIMHSKWADAIIQVLAFDRLDHGELQVSHDPFCVHMVRLFIQLSALATMHLHEEALPDPELSSPSAVLHEAERKLVRAVTTKVRQARTKTKDAAKAVWAQPAPTARPPPAERRPQHQMPMPEMERASTTSHEGERTTMKREPSELRGEYANEEDLFHNKLFSEEEIAYFHNVPDKVHSQISRIIRAITTRQRAGGIKAPAPIVSRVFQELSNGVLAYNNACKMKEVPVPFALVHFNALLLLFFILTAPLVVSCFTGNLFMSIFTSCAVTGGFASLWLVANELEDPFGYDENDLAMSEYHEDFRNALKSSLDRPWMACDTWTVAEGAWQPHAAAAAASALAATTTATATATAAAAATAAAVAAPAITAVAAEAQRSSQQASLLPAASPTPPIGAGTAAGGRETVKDSSLARAEQDGRSRSRLQTKWEA